MKLSKKANYLLIIGFLVILNVLFRFPITPHELGADSFGVHGMANFISENGYAKWIMHPLSFFGLYPLSYPSGAIFYLSGISQSTGIDTEYSILVVSTFLGVLGALTTYLMAKEILDDDFFAFATAFIFSTSRVFLAYTTWTYTLRGFFMVLLPLFIWSLLRFSSSAQGKLKYIILAGVLLIILGTAHHVVLFIPLVLIAYFITIFLNRIRHKFESPFIMRVIPPVFLALFTFLFLMQFTGFTFYNPSYYEFQSYFFHGSEFYIILLNMGIHYAKRIGILTILIPIGLVSLVFKSNKKLPEIFLLVLLLCLTPFLMDSIYMPTFIVSVLSLFISLGLLAILKAISNVKFKRAEKVAIPILMMILLFSAFLPCFVAVGGSEHLPGYTSHMSERTYNAGLFMKGYGNGSTISNDGFIEAKMKATSGALTFEDPDKYDFSTVRRIPLSVILSEHLDTFYTIQDCYFDYRGYYSGLHRNNVMSRSCDDNLARKICSGDNIHYAVVNNYNPTKWYNANSRKFENSPFLISVQMKKYKVYDDGLESIWYF